MVGLLDGAAGEARLVLDNVLQPGLARYRIVAPHDLVPGPVGARPHGVHAGQAADIARDDAAGGEQEARQRDHVAVAGLGRIVGHAPQRIVVADAVGRSEEHTSELQSLRHLVCRLLLEKKKKNVLNSLSSKEKKYKNKE